MREVSLLLALLWSPIRSHPPSSVHGGHLRARIYIVSSCHSMYPPPFCFRELSINCTNMMTESVHEPQNGAARFASSGLCHPMLPLHTTPRKNSSLPAAACSAHFSACLKCTLFSASSWPHHIMHALPVPGSHPQGVCPHYLFTQSISAPLSARLVRCFTFVSAVGPLC